MTLCYLLKKLKKILNPGARHSKAYNVFYLICKNQQRCSFNCVGLKTISLHLNPWKWPISTAVHRHFHVFRQLGEYWQPVAYERNVQSKRGKRLSLRKLTLYNIWETCSDWSRNAVGPDKIVNPPFSVCKDSEGKINIIYKSLTIGIIDLNEVFCTALHYMWAVEVYYFGISANNLSICVGYSPNIEVNNHFVLNAC